MTAVTPVERAVTPTVGQAVRRIRFWVVIVLVLAVVAIGGALITGAGRAGATFGPDNAAPAGGRALRAVLEQQGVHVHVVDRLADATSATGTVFVDEGGGLLPRSAWGRISAGRQRLIVASPDLPALQALLPAAHEAGSPEGSTAAAGCDLGLAERAGSMALAGVALSLRDTDATVCFTDAGGAGQLVTGRADGTRVILLADRTAFTNEHVGVAGNAAVALNALGATPDLTWYTPDPLDLGIRSTTTLQDLTPAWVTPVAALLLLGGIAAAFWRGRRLGPIVVEALPVVVRSRETMEGRARLYGRARARLRAADALRIGAVGRMAPVLGLGRTASVDEVAGAAARTTGRRRDEVRALVVGEDPATDRDLVRISDDLARLEAAVRAAAVPGTADPTKGTE